MATGTGVNVSKVNLYGLLTPPVGVSVSKTNLYSLLTPPVGVSVSKTNLYAVLTSAAPPVWNAFTPNNGTVGTPYLQTFSASGTPTITYSVVSGSLPTGLSLSGASITGTPTVAGTSSFTLRATNAFGTADYPTSIQVYAAASGGAAIFVF